MLTGLFDRGSEYDFQPYRRGWATDADLEQAGLLYPATGTGVPVGTHLYLGQRLAQVQDDRGRFSTQLHHVLGRLGWPTIGLGPTGSGKTHGLVLPNLVSWGRGACVVVSSKNDILRPWQVRAAYGPVYLYDPSGSQGLPHLTIGWDPLWRCDDWDHAYRMAERFTAPQMKDESARNAQHFATKAAAFLAPLLYGAALSHQSRTPYWYTMEDVSVWVAAGSLAEAHQEIDLAAAAGDADAAYVRRQIEGMLRLQAEAGEYWQGIVGAASAALTWVHRHAARVSTNPRLTPRQLDIDALLDGATLFVTSPAHLLEDLAPLHSALIDAVLQRALERATLAGGRLPVPLLLAIDEAAAAPVDKMPRIFAEGAQQGIVSLLIVQDLSQLYARIGQAQAHSIWNNARIRMVLPGLSDPASLDLLTRQAAEYEEEVRTDATLTGETSGLPFSRQLPPSRNNQTSTSWSTRYRAAVRPEHVLYLPERRAILLAPHVPPAEISLRFLEECRPDRPLEALLPTVSGQAGPH